MLTRVDLVDLQGRNLPLLPQDPSNGYILKKIEGLDPVNATIVSSSFALLDGSQFQGARRENRNIVITVGIGPFYGGATVKALRAALYGYLMPKSFVELRFYEDNVYTVSIVGQVESFEAPLFAKEPEAAISIICFDPNFVATTTTTVNGNTVSSTVEQTVAYSGTIETGYVFSMTVNRNDLTAFTLSNRRPDNTQALLDVAYAFTTGDVVTISTVNKDKYIKLTRGGVTTSILYAVSASAKWGPLYPGNNFIKVFTPGAAIPFTIVYTAKYGGL